MGIARKIALTGGLSIGAILLVAWLASQTDILSKFKNGLSSLGKNVGSGIGQGVGNIPLGFAEGLGSVYDNANKNYDLLGVKKSYADLLNFLGLKDPAANINPDFGYSEPPLANPNNDPTITPNNRDLYDVKANLKKSKFGNFGTVTSYTKNKSGNISSVTRKISKSDQRSNPRFKSAKDKAKKRTAAKKSGKCFNYDLDMGGVGQHTYRMFGVIPLHG